jgi:hypothetical protein
MALRIKSAMTALLFCEPNTLSNSALMSSGTLKFTVAISRAYAIVETFNNPHGTEEWVAVNFDAGQTLRLATPLF